MSLTELYTKSAKVWLPDPGGEIWKSCTLLEDYKEGVKQLKVYCERDDQELTIQIKSSADLPHLKNPDILIGENDLTALSYLHEPAVLHNLQVRFCDRNYIYTYCGIVLVAINPYQQLDIYNNDTIRAYSGQDMGSMDPHMFAVAEEAFKRMSRFEENQSLIVSGESGAGKTVSAKYAMRYFATVCGAESETSVEKRLLASNPIMEAIGNAKTTRNDNSSRFGKYIQIGFSKAEQITGANMRTYLLEKSRVVFQAAEERNYHIFYQLCSAAELDEFKGFHLAHADEFSYTNQGEAPVVSTIDDAEDFVHTRQALTILGINPLQQMNVFRILAGILHLGNIKFKEEEKSGETHCTILPTDKSLPLMSGLLGIDAEQIRYWLCNKKIVTAQEVLTVPLTSAQVSFARDALAKHIYSQLFLWIVAELNKALSDTGKTANFIGVLDIYGFETFEYNSFEQFCINYANEKLQQQFCRHVFKLEQEEYVREEIEWSFIDFYDNQPCIDLIENKLGILDLLDEECKMPNGSDENWCQKLFTKHGKSKHFEKPRMSRVSFIIHHFADNVEYQIEGFIEKNRDTLLEEHVNILKASEYELLAELFSDKTGPAAGEGAAKPGGRPNARGGAMTVRSSGRGDPSKASQSLKQHRKTVGSQFHDSLNLLMETLCATTPHYVRCIKPNDSKTPFLFDPERAVQQLRACGVLETVRISAAGYPSRWMYADFFKRYRVLAVSKDIVKNQQRKTCENILVKLIADRDKYQFGKTKIFFRAGQVAYLEKLRSERLRKCSVIIQKRVRGWLARRRYTKIRRTALLVQKYARGLLARRHAMMLRKTRAVNRLRAAWLGYKQRKKYQSALRAIIYIQSYARGLIGRQKFISEKMERKIVLIQRTVRGWEARRKFKKVMRGIILVQSHFRRRKARRELKQLKIEARSVEKMKNVAKGLENKIIELQMKLDERSKEVGALKEEQQQTIELKNEVSRLRSADVTSKQSADRIQELERRIAELSTELEEEKRDREKVVIEKENICRQKDELIGGLNEENTLLKKQLDSASEELQKRNSDLDGLVKQKIEETNAALKAEFESERVHHQKMVRDYTRLQQRLENLQQDLHLKGPGVASLLSRSPSNVSNMSVDSGESEKTDTDPGYGTTRRKAKERESLAAALFEKQPGSETGAESQNSGQVPVLEVKDIPLMTRVQNRVRELEKDKARLRLELDRRDRSADICNGSGIADLGELEILDAYRIQELETENARLKHDLQQLQKAVAEGAVSFDMKGVKTKVAANQLLEQLATLKEDVKLRQTDCVRLRTLLAQALARSSHQGSSASTDSNLINEDGELEMAYRTQKELNALLEKELQRLQKVSEMREVDLNKQLAESKTELEKHIKLNGQALSSNPEARLEATIQLEISRLLNENLILKEQNDKMSDMIKNLRKALKIYSKRLKSTDVSEANAELEKELAAEADGLPAVKHHTRECQGMYEYRSEDEQLLIKNLILDLKPHAMLKHLPGLPAHVLFMCMRYTDHINNDEKVRSLLTGAINGIKKVVKKRQDDPETITAWLSNTCQLLNNLRQYSGEKTFQSDNTPHQNEQCLRNFDLGEYRQILNDLAVWICQLFIKLAETQIQPMIVSSILDNESISGLTTGKQTGIRRDLSRQDDESDAHPNPESLTKTLDNIMQVLVVHAVDMEVVSHLFKQLFYYICANALNNLLLRKNMCHWMKGMQIRYNLSQLEQWLRDNRLQDSGVQEMLEPVIQATQLLQARKTDADVDSVCDMCTHLNVLQVVKILNLYTPLNEFEERVPSSFIRQIQSKLSATKSSSQSLLMDTKFVFAISFPFRASNVALETLSAPSEWGLGFLQKI